MHALGQLSDIEIRRLRVFRVVAESGGISAAELELNIGRSTISTHIKDLETRLGVTLCRRGRGGFALTDEGELIYQATLRLLGSLDEFRSEVDDLHQRMTGHISLAMFDKIASNPEAHVGKAFQLFDDLAPDMSFEVYVEPLNEVERGVTNITYDPELLGRRRKISDWLGQMGKTKHLMAEGNEQRLAVIEEEAERRWRRIKAMHEHPEL